MSNELDRFCDSVHEKLETLQGRMDSLKLNIGTTWHSLQMKLDEVRRKGKKSKQKIAEARINLEAWVNEDAAEAKSTVIQWIEEHERQKLVSRAQKAEDRACAAIMIAQASIDDAELMILEAIAARLDAEAVTTG
jgi:hypothetical protein